MNTRILAAAIVVAVLAGCAGTPLNRVALRQHAERSCRAQSTVSKAYAIDGTGVGMRSVAYVRCLRTAGFRAEA